MIIITGTIAYDHIMDFPGKFGDHIMPDQIHNINLSFIVNKFAKRRGGTAGNTSYSLGLLKTPHILFSYAGKDFDEYKKSFERLGIATDYVKIDRKNHTSTGFAMTDKTNNQIWGYFYGASNNIEKLELNKISSKKNLVLIGPSGVKGSMNFVDQCVKNKIEYIFDPGFILTDIDNNQLSKGIENAKYIIGNDYELKMIRDRVKNWEKIFRNKIIITTLGENGAEIEEDGKKYKINPAKPKKVVDPSGAGDAWRGGFLAGLQRGFNLKTCGQMGSVASVFAVEVYGAQEYFYSKEEFKKRYRQNFNSVINL